MNKLTQRFIPGVICGIIILILTGLPGSCFPTVPTFWQWLTPDKIVHLIMFGGLAVSIVWGYRDDYVADKTKRRRLVIIALLITIAYGGLTEHWQNVIFINRSGNIFDFSADAVGAILGVIIFKAAYKKKDNIIKPIEKSL